MWGKGAFTKAIKYFDPSSSTIPRIIGPALTVDTGPGDILALLASLKFIEKGDIVGHLLVAIRVVRQQVIVWLV